MGDLHPNCKVWIYSVNFDGVFGDGKVRLLEAVHRHASLRQAAAVLNISYRKAWGDLRKAETCLQVKLIERSRGGRGGGRMSLTATGRELVAAYHRFREQVQQELGKAYDRHLKDLLEQGTADGD